MADTNCRDMVWQR